jgi:hypothetical protein
MPHANQCIGIGIRQRLDQHRIHHAEDRGVRADADSKRQDRDRRKAGLLPKSAGRVTQVLEDHLECGSHARVSNLFFHLIRAVVVKLSAAYGIFPSHALRDAPLNHRVEKSADFIVQLGFAFPGVSQSP